MVSVKAIFIHIVFEEKIFALDSTGGDYYPQPSMSTPV